MIPIYFAGIDLGSTMTKVVIIDDSEKMLAYVVQHTGAEHRRLANRVMEEALRQADITIDDINYVIATGYGRINVPFADKQITELTCYVRGVAHFFPSVRLAIDIGGQDAKGMKIKNGKLIDFVMSDKCAAGAGRFLDIIANVLQIPLEGIGALSLKSNNPVIFTTACAVSGESEAVSRVAEGVSKEDILAGVHKALAEKIGSMVDRVGMEPKYGICGGGALNMGLVEWVQRRLGVELLVPPQPDFITALGAAIFAREQGKTDSSS